MKENVMSQGVLPLVGDCPTASEHGFEIPLPRGPVAGLMLHCPNCAGPVHPSPVDELSEMVAARRVTIAGLAGLPDRTRADLDGSGALARLYQSMVTEVRDVAERCRAQFGGELPAGLRAVRADSGADSGPDARLDVSDRTQVWVTEVWVVLDAAADWLARVTPRPAR
jgi:hypothetical protein